MSKLIIGVAGRSGSGKTTFVRQLMDHLGDESSLHSLDNYYRPRDEQYVDEQGYINFDLPDSFYKDQYIQDFEMLMNGLDISVAEYDFNNKGEKKLRIIKSADILIVEGLLVYHFERVRNRMDIKILIDLDYENCLRRRLLRDQRERNYTREEILYRYKNHVEPSFQKYLRPYRSNMDLLIDNQSDMNIGLEKTLEHISTYR